ncbi:hypothetical protein PACTADRAFT_37451 [Pachysolen tannophilus NRRL Y-2460]|uniref:Mitochondrial carrier protein n=1 Tax=Pachysolen tannophilus NRRL Y-2460 TaxID=669874 RepID=A0A1E4U0K9_PACTA|nr:hypothetical protein PACTADRAFT_37451 [Pachysolen tannophilus NRRL Y-2460]
MGNKGTTSANVEPNLVTAVIAGSSAAIVQTLVTYPFEFIKTCRQLQKANAGAIFQIAESHGRDFFIGCNGLAIGNALKASSRFFIFNSTSKFMANDSGSTTAPRVVVAGLMTGFIESLFVIPFENIKTTSIQNFLILQNRSKEISDAVMKAKGTLPPPSTDLRSNKSPPQYLFLKVCREIYNTRGLRGFTQGSSITVLRQIMNSMVWFSTYNGLKTIIDPLHDLDAVYSLFAGFLSSAAVVAITQPIDVVKTRIQAKDYSKHYKDSFTCLFKIFVNEGIATLWSGWLPRLFKVSLSGTITLASYQAVENTVNLALKENPFAAE